ncbi:MAG: BtrH N-terminal domain-containing protein [Lachnoclostridium sp.]|nr:BtrH N-terminal domain-containing protein [Lachnospira sp.]MCM1248925.1 BtrH N-terminal domain-containing protein [Lachnoclostridium sp.]
MILNVKPLRTPALRMKADIYATFINYIGKDYMLLLSSAWGFRVNLKNVKYSYEYINLEEDTLEYCLNNYYGIHTELITYNDFSDYWNDICNSLEDRTPIVLNVSSIGLPYHRTYMDPEAAHEHPVLLIGYDEENVYFLDPPWTLDIIKLEKSSLSKILLSIEKICLDNEINDVKVDKVLNRILDKVNRKDYLGDMFDSIYYFAEIFERKFDILIELNTKSYDMETLRFHPMISSLDYIGRLRLCMVDVLKHMAKKYEMDSLNTISDLFQQISQAWIRLRYILIKGCCKDREEFLNARKNVAEKIRSMATQERMIRDEIQKIVDNSFICKNNTGEENFNNLEVIEIDLKKYFNNCAFHNTKNQLKANFNIKEVEYYISDSIKPTEHIILEKMQFKMPDIYSEEFDNISCQGQSIAVDLGFYSSIMLMGFAVYKGYAGCLTVLYEDNTTEEVNFALTNSGSHKTLFGEVIVLTTDFISKGKMKKGNIYGIEVLLESKKKIKEIILPEWEMCNIMGISLCKKQGDKGI